MWVKYELFLVTVVGCGSVDSPNNPPPTCDPQATFGKPVAIMGLANAGFTESVARFSHDELTVCFGGGPGAHSDLYVARRSSLAEAFMTPALITSQSSAAFEAHPTVSSDELTLWFESNRSNLGFQVYTATRASTLAEFGAPELAAVNSVDLNLYDEGQPFLTADNAELWFVSNRGGENNTDIWYAMRTAGGFSQPVNALGLNSPSFDWLPTLSADRLTVYFSSNRGGGSFDIWAAHRSTIDDGFPAPVIVDEINSTAADYPTWLSPDGCRLYLTSDRSGEFNVYMATRQP